MLGGVAHLVVVVVGVVVVCLAVWRTWWWLLFALRFVAMVGEICRFKITKVKHYLKESQPDEHEEFPLNNGGETYLTQT